MKLSELSEARLSARQLYEAVGMENAYGRTPEDAADLQRRYDAAYVAMLEANARFEAVARQMAQDAGRAALAERAEADAR